MKLIAKVKLLTSSDQKLALLDALHTSNAACNWISETLWKAKKFRPFAAHPLAYHEVRERFALGAQITTRCIAKVCDSYVADKTHQHEFKQNGGIPYDERLMSWSLKDSTVSLWTKQGRTVVIFIAGPKQMELLKSRQGQADLLYHRGVFYLAAACEVNAPTLTQVDEFIGVDFGINQIATDSDGDGFSGGVVKGVRHRHRRMRTRLQKKGTRAATRRLRRLSGQEKRFATDVNHYISKQIVAKAKGTCRGLALENLTHIHKRITARRKDRASLHSWSFGQLRTFIEYKAALAGVPVVIIDPRNTSRQCARCLHISKSNRLTQKDFRCVACGHEDHADINAAIVISGRAFISKPNVARNLQLQA